MNWDKLASSYGRWKCKEGKRLTITNNFSTALSGNAREAGPVTSAWLANQIRGFSISARSDSWKCCPRPAASGSIFKPSVTAFYHRGSSQPAKNIFKWHICMYGLLTKRKQFQHCSEIHQRDTKQKSDLILPTLPKYRFTTKQGAFAFHGAKIFNSYLRLLETQKA